MAELHQYLHAIFTRVLLRGFYRGDGTREYGLLLDRVSVLTLPGLPATQTHELTMGMQQGLVGATHKVDLLTCANHAVECA